MAKTKQQDSQEARATQTPPQTPSEVRALFAGNLGNGFVNGEANDGAQAIKFDYRSVLATPPRTSMMAPLPGEWAFTFEKRRWVFGERAYQIAPDSIIEQVGIDRYTSAEYRVLLASAFHKAFGHLVGKTIYPAVAMDVPAQVFRQPETLAKIKKHLAGQYLIGNTAGGEILVDVLPEHLKIGPEGLGCYYNALMGDNPEPRIAKGTWAFLDFGYLTLDVVVVSDGNYLANAARSNDGLGMNEVATKLSDHVLAETGFLLPRALMDEAMRCPTVNIRGEEFAIAEHRDMLLDEYAERATLWLIDVLKGVNAQGAYVLGGGATHLFGRLGKLNNKRRLPPLTLAADPHRVNVLGLFAWLKRHYANVVKG